MEPVRLISTAALKKKPSRSQPRGRPAATASMTPRAVQPVPAADEAEDDAAAYGGAAMERMPVLQRLRAAGLRPTIARIGIYQVIAAAKPYGVSADEVYQRMLQRGTRASASTVYRVIREFDEHDLVSSVWDESKKAVYLIKSHESDPRVVLIGCSRTGRLVAVDDAELHERLVAAARRYGLEIEGRDLLVRA